MFVQVHVHVALRVWVTPNGGLKRHMQPELVGHNTIEARDQDPPGFIQFLES